MKPLDGEFEGLLRLRVGNHRVLFGETDDTITVHRVRDRRNAYRGAAERSLTDRMMDYQMADEAPRQVRD